MALLSVIRRWYHRDQMSIREISRRTGLSRNTLCKYLRSEVVEPRFRTPDRPTKLDPYADRLWAWLRREMIGPSMRLPRWSAITCSRRSSAIRPPVGARLGALMVRAPLASGQVEKNVQDARHRLWQPIPHAESLGALNLWLEQRCRHCGRTSRMGPSPVLLPLPGRMNRKA